MGKPNTKIVGLLFGGILFTAAVTGLRFYGEWQQWPPEMLFHRAAGGGGSPLGIGWLVPIFGFLFGSRLKRGSKDRPGSGKFILLGLAVMAGGIYGAFQLLERNTIGQVLMVLGCSVAGGLLCIKAWPRLGLILLVYGLGARLPVIGVSYYAMQNNLGTHYDRVPPEVTEVPPFPDVFYQFVVAPQLAFWVPFTLVVGSWFGLLAAVMTRWK
jgi:hypothetical protein